MKLIIVWVFLCMIINTSAQSISKDIYASAGESLGGTSATINFTVGEPVVGLVSSSESIDQGFWSSSGILVIPLTVNQSPIEIVVYPNPVIEELTISAGHTKVLGIQLFAVNAQRVLVQRVDATQLDHKIDMSYLTRGVYILQLFLEGHDELREYKIIKN